MPVVQLWQKKRNQFVDFLYPSPGDGGGAGDSHVVNGSPACARGVDRARQDAAGKGDTLVADLRIGDMFKGDHLIYIPQQTERLFVLTDTGCLT